MSTLRAEFQLLSSEIRADAQGPQHSGYPPHKVRKSRTLEARRESVGVMIRDASGVTARLRTLGNSRLLALLVALLTCPAASIYAHDTCDDPPLFGQNRSCLLEVPPLDSLDARTPLILIHGINLRGGIPAEPIGYSTWMAFLDHFSSDVAFRSKYKLYVFNYWSNEPGVTVPNLAAKFGETVNRMSTDDHAFGSRPFVIIAHSMGGLIARSFMQEYGGDSRVLSLITLATPHHGSPLANGPARNHASRPRYSARFQDLDDLLLLFGGVSFDDTNRSDLHWDSLDGLLDYAAYSGERNTWLESLNNDRTVDAKITAYAGWFSAARPCPSLLPDSLVYCPCEESLEHAFVCTFLSCPNPLWTHVYYSDGVVPVDSALFYDYPSLLPRVSHRVFGNHDHTQMHDGNGQSSKPCGDNGPGDDLFACLRIDLGVGVADSALAAPNVQSPGLFADPGSSLTSTAPTFRWLTVPGADGYGLYVSRYDSGAWNLVFDSERDYGLIPGTSTSLALPVASGLVPGQRYRWNMRTIRASAWGPFSDRLYFQVNTGASVAVGIGSDPAGSALLD